MQKLLLLFGALVLSSCAGLAQSAPSSWSRLSSLQPGQTVQVVDTSSKKYSGTFVSASDTAMTIQESSSQQSIQRSDVRSVKSVQSGQSNRARNIALFGAIGAGAGAGIGTGVGASGCFGCRKAKSAGIGAGLGAIVGVAVGAVLPARKSTLVYKASAH